jgi:hypothetical protein
MPRRKKPARDLTTREALRRLFPTDARREVKKEAEKSRKDEEKRSTKKDPT